MHKNILLFNEEEVCSAFTLLPSPSIVKAVLSSSPFYFSPWVGLRHGLPSILPTQTDDGNKYKNEFSNFSDLTIQSPINLAANLHLFMQLSIHLKPQML